REWLIDISVFKGFLRPNHPPQVYFVSIRLINRGLYQSGRMPEGFKTNCQQFDIKRIQIGMFSQKYFFKIGVEILEERSLAIGTLEASQMNFSPVLAVVHLHIDVSGFFVSPNYRNTQVLHLVSQLNPSPVSVTLFLVIVMFFNP